MEYDPNFDQSVSGGDMGSVGNDFANHRVPHSLVIAFESCEPSGLARESRPRDSGTLFCISNAGMTGMNSAKKLFDDDNSGEDHAKTAYELSRLTEHVVYGVYNATAGNIALNFERTIRKDLGLPPLFPATPERQRR
jgi:hypothetical protein